MRRFFLTALSLCFVVATSSEAWAWGSVTGPRGGTAYRGAFGGGAVQGPRGGSAYRGPAGRTYAQGPNGGTAYRGPYAAGARGPAGNGAYAYRGPTAYNYYYGHGVVTPGVAAGVAAGVAVGTAAGAYASSSTSYYPSPYYCAFGDPSCAPGAAPAEAAAGGGGQGAGNAQTACRGDAQRLCPSAVAARDRAAAQACLIQNIDKTSAACHQALAAAGAAPAASPAPAAPPAPAPAHAASPASQPAADPQTACRGDAQRLCASAVAARDRAAAKSCLIENIDKTSAACHQALEQAMR
jgi:hypothetical protein